MAKLSPTAKNQYTSIPVHNAIKKRLKKYDRVETLLAQDEDDIMNEFCRKLPNEKPLAYSERKKTFNDTFLNITQDLVTAPTNSVFTQGIKMEYGADNSIIKKFNENVTGTASKISMQRYLREVVGLQLRAYGSTCVIIDKPRNGALTREQELEIGMPYITSIRMQDIITWQLDRFGEFEWFMYKKTYSKPWSDPFLDDMPVAIEVECLYTKTDYVVREVGGKVINELSYIHNWGFVPVVIQGSFLLNQGDIVGNSAMFQSSLSIISMNNFLNVGAYELYKHGGALLLMPEDAMSQYNIETDSSGDPKLKKMDNAGTLTYSGEIPPSYLIKDLKANEFMDWAMFYNRAAVENERDLKSVTKKGTDGEMVQESGFAKMIDREPLESNLVAHSDDMEVCANKINDKVARVLKVTNDCTIEFDKDYDLRSVKQKYEEIGLAIKNKIEKVSPTLFREHYKNIAPDVTRDQKVLMVVNQEIDDYNPDLLEEEINEEIKKELKTVDSD